MKNIIYILNTFIISLSIIYAEDSINIAWFNFNKVEVDRNNEIHSDLSNQVFNQFINIAKKDMKFIDGINFIPTKQLDREYKQISDKMIDIIIPLFKDNFYGSIDRNILINQIKMISDKFTLAQMNFLVDSIIVYVEKTTKSITTDMMDFKNGLSNADINILNTLISQEIDKTLKKQTFLSFMVSAIESFKTDVIIIGEYLIIKDEININLQLYNSKDFSLINSIYSKSFINKVHILIKDLEFKLLSKLGIDINQIEKEQLSQYDFNSFSKKYYSLYFSNIFESSDIKEIKYRLQIDDQYNFLNSHYKTFFRGLFENKIGYMIKLYDDDNYYQVYSTESYNSSSVTIDILRSDWKNQVGGVSNRETRLESPKSQRIMNIQYSDIESIYLHRGQDNLISLLKQITIYSSVIAVVFLLNIFI